MSMTEDKVMEQPETSIEMPVKEQVENKAEEPVVDMDIDLSATRKKRLRIDGDANRILELNVSDMNLLSRLTDSYPKLEKLQEKAMKISEQVASDGDNFDEVKLGKDLKQIDKEMRDILDKIFNANVSEVCAPDGSMFDPFGGVCRYERIINALVRAYEDNIAKEAESLRKNVGKYVNKKQGKK